VPAGQTWPQAPQLVLLFKLTQTPAQTALPAGQEDTHTPFEHVALEGQTEPQVPQLSWSVRTLTQALPQRVVPDRQRRRASVDSRSLESAVSSGPLQAGPRSAKAKAA